MLKKLSVEEVLFYRVPRRIANNPNNLFVGRGMNPHDLDGPWPLISFQIVEKEPHLLILSACGVHPEDLEYKPFNPLECEGGYLNLSGGDINQLIYFMNKFITRLPSSDGLGEKEAKNSFREITSIQKLKKLHLSEDGDPYSQRKFYIKANNSLELYNELVHSVMLLSTPTTIYKASYLFFNIMHIPYTSLKDPSYAPFDYAPAKKVINRKELEDLIGILSESHDFLLSQQG